MDRESRSYRAFLIYLSLTVALLLCAIFLAVAVQTREFIYDGMLVQARAYFNNILIIRKWNASYGGVYVEKKEGMQSNPYLKDPDFTSTDGKVYTLKNPALMTREISLYADNEGQLTYNMTSLKPLNPSNLPDRFERVALNRFENGEKEVYEVSGDGSNSRFRYMAPLFVEEECLGCHRVQGYKTGEVRGGISVSFSVDGILGRYRDKIRTILVLGAGIIVLFIGVIVFFTARLTGKLSEARQRIINLAITDELTDIYNRRHIMARFKEEFERAKRQHEQLGCIMLDIDDFKDVNDTLGHLEGDVVLREVAFLLKSPHRAYDIQGRYGGEEFLIILPGTGFEDTVKVARRIREDVAAGFGEDTERPALPGITISLGVAALEDKDESIDDILKRADQGLYKAKDLGKNTVGWV